MEEKIKMYLDWKGSYAPRACINYKIWLNRFVDVCGKKELEAYSISDLVKFLKWIETRYSPSTVMFATVALKNFFKFYKRQSYKCLAPSLIRIKRINPKSHRAIKEEEFKRIIAEIPVNEFIPLRDQIIIRMLWDTGVRVSELCDLDVMQIDENKTSSVISTKKTGKKRAIVWSRETHGLLLKYMPIRLELHKSNNATALFVGRDKHRGWSLRLTARSVQRMIKDYVRHAGIYEKITPHSFRHGWAHKRRDMNAPLAFIQRGLGHNNPISTFIYEQYCDTDFMKNAKSYLNESTG